MSQTQGWICRRCGRSNPEASLRCAGCNMMRTRAVQNGAKRMRCKVCFFEFSGAGNCPVCASGEVEELPQAQAGQ